jgi:hypothetical protein
MPPYCLIKFRRRFGGNYLLLAYYWYLFGVFVDHKDGANAFLRNAGEVLPDNTASRLDIVEFY